MSKKLPAQVCISRFSQQPTELASIISESDSLILMARIKDDYLVDGFSVVQKKDIYKCHNIRGDIRFKTATQYFGLNPPNKCPINVKVESWYKFLTSWLKTMPLAVHVEQTMPDRFYIGYLTKITSRFLTLRTISKECRMDSLEKIQINNLTRIDFGGRYETIIHIAVQKMNAHANQ